MSRMPDSEYNEMIRVIRDQFEYNSYASKDRLQRIYDDIYYRYDDGAECIRRLDHYQTKWTMNLH